VIKQKTDPIWNNYIRRNIDLKPIKEKGRKMVKVVWI